MNDVIQVMLSNMCCGAGVCGIGLGASQPRDKLRPGEEITVLVRQLRRGGRGGLFREVIFADGSEFIYQSATP